LAIFNGPRFVLVNVVDGVGDLFIVRLALKVVLSCLYISISSLMSSHCRSVSGR
jgi:hypothetical protein